MSSDEIVLVMNFVNGSNLDKLLFSQHLHDYKVARYISSINLMLFITIIVIDDSARDCGYST